MTGQAYDIQAIISCFRRPKADLRLCAAHRGLRWNGTPEQSAESIHRAADAGFPSIEIDVQLTDDGVAVVLHDEGLGRVTNIGEIAAQPVYSPFTGKGYNPLVSKMPWHGNIEHLRLKDELGRLTEERVLRLEDLVRFIWKQGIVMLVLLDFKSAAAVEPSYWLLKSLDLRGKNALEFCVFMPPATWYPSPADIEATAWGSDAAATHQPMLIIPAYFASAPLIRGFDAAASLAAYIAHRWTLAIEIEYPGPGSALEPLMDVCRAMKVQRGGDLPALGAIFVVSDLPDPAGRKVHFDVGHCELPPDPAAFSPLIFEDKCGVVLHWLCGLSRKVLSKPPFPLDGLLQPGESRDGHDRRADLDWLLSEGFDWFMIDHGEAVMARWKAEGKLNVSHLRRPRKDGRAAISGA